MAFLNFEIVEGESSSKFSTKVIKFSKSSASSVLTVGSSVEASSTNQEAGNCEKEIIWCYEFLPLAK